MTTLREAAGAAYLEQERLEAARQERAYENLKAQATGLIKSLLGFQPGEFTKHLFGQGLDTTIDGIQIWANFDSWIDQTDVFLFARVWTSDDGMQWMPFFDLATLGELLAADADRPDDWQKYDDPTITAIIEEVAGQ